MMSPQLSSFEGVNSTSLALSCLIDLIPALEELVVLMSLARWQELGLRVLCRYTSL